MSISSSCFPPLQRSLSSAFNKITHAPERFLNFISNFRKAGNTSDIPTSNIKQQNICSNIHISNIRAVNQNEISPLLDDLSPTQMINEKISLESQTNKLWTLLEQIQYDDISFVNLPNARFHNVPTAMHSLVTAPDGIQLPANRIQIDGKNIAIACQYPATETLDSFLKMMVKNSSVLVVLASETDIAKGLPPYFRENQTYNDMKVTSSQRDTVELCGLHLERYMLNVEGGGDKPISIPVVHVTNWGDFESISPEQSRQLAEFVLKEKTEWINALKEIGSHVITDPNKLLAHCRGGVGRTGQLLATMALLDPDCHLSLQSIVEQMRKSRNPMMVQTRKQLSELVSLAQSLNKPIFEQDVKELSKAANPIGMTEDNGQWLHALNNLLSRNKYSGEFNTKKPQNLEERNLPAVWLSSSHPGKFAFHIPGHKQFSLSERLVEIAEQFNKYYKSLNILEY